MLAHKLTEQHSHSPTVFTLLVPPYINLKHLNLSAFSQNDEVSRSHIYSIQMQIGGVFCKVSDSPVVPDSQFYLKYVIKVQYVRKTV